MGSLLSNATSKPPPNRHTNNTQAQHTHKHNTQTAHKLHASYTQTTHNPAGRDLRHPRRRRAGVAQGAAVIGRDRRALRAPLAAVRLPRTVHAAGPGLLRSLRLQIRSGQGHVRGHRRLQRAQRRLGHAGHGAQLLGAQHVPPAGRRRHVDGRRRRHGGGNAPAGGGGARGGRAHRDQRARRGRRRRQWRRRRGRRRGGRGRGARGRAAHRGARRRRRLRCVVVFCGAGPLRFGWPYSTQIPPNPQRVQNIQNAHPNTHTTHTQTYTQQRKHKTPSACATSPAPPPSRAPSTPAWTRCAATARR